MEDFVVGDESGHQTFSSQLSCGHDETCGVLLSITVMTVILNQLGELQVRAP